MYGGNPAAASMPGSAHLEPCADPPAHTRYPPVTRVQPHPRLLHQPPQGDAVILQDGNVQRGAAVLQYEQARDIGVMEVWSASKARNGLAWA